MQTWLIVILTAVLVCVTYWYARITNRILKEQQKTGEDIKRLATAAEESVQQFRQQAEEYAGVAQTMLLATIESGLRIVNSWRDHNIVNLAYTQCIPTQLDLVPSGAGIAVQHAARISAHLASFVSDGFDRLRQVQEELEVMRDARMTSPELYQKHSTLSHTYLDRAEEAFCAALQQLKK